MISRHEINLYLFVGGVQLDKEYTAYTEIPYKTHRSWSMDFFTLQIDIHNPTQKIFEGNLCEFGLITSNIFPRAENVKSSSRMPGRKHIHILPRMGVIFPGGWTALKARLVPDYEISRDVSMIVRVFTELGTSDYRFVFKINEEEEEEEEGR